jgi:hypothetical protein
MSHWSIKLPIRGPNAPLADLIADAFSFKAEERDVVHELVSQAILSSCETTGDLLDRLNGASVAERRTILDNAREAAGLESATAIDDEEAFKHRQEMARRRSSGRDAAGKVLQGCAAEGCSALPMSPTGLGGRSSSVALDEGQLHRPLLGFLTVDSHDDDGVRVLDEVTLFEITLMPSPANADTRITEMKSVPDIELVPSLDELKARFDLATKDLEPAAGTRDRELRC